MHAILLLPVLSALTGLAFFAVTMAVVQGDHAAVLARYGGAVQLAATSALLVGYAAAGGSGADAFRGPAVLSVEHAGWVVAGFVVGAASFGAELVTAHVWHRLGGRSSRAVRIREGGSRGLLAADVRSRMFVVVGVGLAVTEELLWRQLAVGQLVRNKGWAPATAVAVTAALFGLNHYWFGARNVVAKAIDGGAWAVLLVLSGTVTAAIAAHVAFQWLVVRRLARQQVLARSDVLGGDRAGTW